MILSADNGWSTALADLSLILFMICALALSQSEPVGAGAAAAAPDMDGAYASSEPVALYAPVAGGVSLADWLADQSRDPRQRLTIVARHGQAGSGMLFDQALDLAAQARQAGWTARIIFEPADSPGLVAQIAYDHGPDQMARQLQIQSQTPAQASVPTAPDERPMP